MDWLWFSIAAFGTLSFIWLIAWVARVVRRHHAYDDLQPFDYGAIEGELTNYVHADLNRMKR